MLKKTEGTDTGQSESMKCFKCQDEEKQAVPRIEINADSSTSFSPRWPWWCSATAPFILSRSGRQLQLERVWPLLLCRAVFSSMNNLEWTMFNSCDFAFQRTAGTQWTDSGTATTTAAWTWCLRKKCAPGAPTSSSIRGATSYRSGRPTALSEVRSREISTMLWGKDASNLLPLHSEHFPGKRQSWMSAAKNEHEIFFSAIFCETVAKALRGAHTVGCSHRSCGQK